MSCPASKGRDVVLTGCVWPDPMLCAGLPAIVCTPGCRILCALLRSACWSCISSCAKTASCLGVSVGKLAWVYSVSWHRRWWLCSRRLRHCWHHSWCWAGLLLHPVDGLQRGYVKRAGCWVGQWRCHWHHWHGKRLRESRWCHCV